MSDVLELFRAISEALRPRVGVDGGQFGVGPNGEASGGNSASRFGGKRDHEIPVDLVYDDEPLEELLYGHVTHGPSAANLYSPFKRLEQALSGTDGTAIEQAFREASCCCESNPTLIPEIVTLLSKLARRCLPQWPKPLNAALSTAGLQLLEFLWKRSRDAEHRSSILSVGSVLWEWYEYARRPALASEVLEEMIGLCQDQDANETLQGLCNNLAYQRFLLQDWSRSQQAYQSACEIAERAGRRADLLNSRVGWWAARYEEQPNEVAAELVAKLRPVLSEIRDLNRLLTARKALRYLALAEARLGQGQSALAFVDQAIEIDRQFQSMFLEEDLALRAAIRGIHTETLLDPVPPDIASID